MDHGLKLAELNGSWERGKVKITNIHLISHKVLTVRELLGHIICTDLNHNVWQITSQDDHEQSVELKSIPDRTRVYAKRSIIQ